VATTGRVFVALWPPPAVRARLSDVAAALPAHTSAGRQVAASNLHLTLAFIGPLEEERVAELGAHVERFRIEPFVWCIDHLGAFPRARVLWAGGAASPALASLAEGVRELLDRLHVEYDRKPFSAHVTLIRDAARLPAGTALIDPPIEWVCERVTLVQSVNDGVGAVYRPLTGT
jgi:RNA 2',3'-cyclic 3'-phosphodiesterase